MGINKLSPRLRISQIGFDPGQIKVNTQTSNILLLKFY